MKEYDIDYDGQCPDLLSKDRRNRFAGRQYTGRHIKARLGKSDKEAQLIWW